jgi:hypothetical protein
MEENSKNNKEWKTMYRKRKKWVFGFLNNFEHKLDTCFLTVFFFFLRYYLKFKPFCLVELRFDNEELDICNNGRSKHT